MPLTKRSIRKDMRSSLASLSDDVWSDQSLSAAKALANWLQQHPDIRKVALYSALPTEVCLTLTTELLSHIEWHFPLVNADGMTFHRVSHPSTLAKGYYDIKEPNPKVHPPIIPSTLDLVVCPGLAFTAQGQRLGRGGGFYDRFLAQHPAPILMGVCLQQQVVPALPVDAHDIAMTHMLYSGEVHTMS